jgi:phage gp36-like protein
MYCTVQDVRDRNSLLLTEPAIPALRVDACIEYAGSIVDGMLCGRYPVPFSPVPAIIRGITADLAAADALSLVVGNRGDNQEPAQSQELRKKAMELLEKIARGGLDLPEALRPASGGRTALSTTYGQAAKFQGWDPCDPGTYRGAV